MIAIPVTTDYVIAPRDFHPWILGQKSLKMGHRFQLMTKENVLESAFFSIKEKEALPYLMNTYGQSYFRSKQILSHLYFLKAGVDPMVDHFIAIQQDLSEKGLLTPAPYAEILFRKKSCYVIGYHPQDPELKTIAQAWGMALTFAALETRLTTKPEVREFLDTEAEVRDALNRIASLISRGVKPNAIALYRPSNHYIEPLKRLSAAFHIPINLRASTPWAHTPIGLKVLTLFQSGADKTTITEALSHFPRDHKEPMEALVQSFFEIPLQGEALSDYIRHVLEETSIPSPLYVEAVQVLTCPIVQGFDHIFIVGFNQDVFPEIKRDNDTLSDAIKQRLGRMTSSLENQNARSLLMYAMASAQHLHLSSKRFHLGEAFQPSSWVAEFGLPVLVNPIYPEDYCPDEGLIKRELLREKTEKYRLPDPYLALYQRAFPTPIQPYVNAFKPWDNDFKQQEMRLSYTKLSDFYKCRFRYYVGKVLQVETIDDRFHLNLGDLAHKLFEQCTQSEAPFDALFEKLMPEYRFPPRKSMIVRGLKEDFLRVIRFNLDHQKKMKLKAVLAEQEVKVKLNPTMTFKGKIDKIIITEKGDQKLVSLIDYKTGKESLNEKEIPFGGSLQLPVYAWLLSQHPEFSQYPLIGLYIQHVLPQDLFMSEGNGDDDEWKKSLKLEGVTLEHIPFIQTFDPTYAKSEFIKGLQVVKDGVTFHKTRSKVRSMKQFEMYRQQAEQKILEATDAIQKGAFDINPVKLGGKSSCATCPFQDVCFRKDRDVRYISLKDEDDHA